MYVNSQEAYQDATACSSVGIFDSKLLHHEAVIDQRPDTQKKMAKVLTDQLFGCFIARQSWNDFWLVSGISGWLYGLWLKHTFGKNEYLHWVQTEMEMVTNYELDSGPLLLQFFSKDSNRSVKR